MMRYRGMLWSPLPGCVSPPRAEQPLEVAEIGVGRVVVHEDESGPADVIDKPLQPVPEFLPEGQAVFQDPVGVEVVERAVVIVTELRWRKARDNVVVIDEAETDRAQ